MSWWGSGTASPEGSGADKASGGAGQKGPWWFWLKVGDSRKMVFLEDAIDAQGGAGTFACYVHDLRLDGVFSNSVRATCSNGYPNEGPCGICKLRWKSQTGKDAIFTKSRLNFFSVADVTPWIRDDGVVYPAKRVILPVKKDMFEILCGKAKKRRDNGDPDGLKGWLVDVSRISLTKVGKKSGKAQEMSPKSGNDFEPIAKVTDPKVLPIKQKDGTAHPGLVDHEGNLIDLKPFDWKVLLAPKTPEELARLFSSHRVTDNAAFGDNGMVPAPVAAAAAAAAGSESPVQY